MCVYLTHSLPGCFHFSLACAHACTDVPLNLSRYIQVFTCSGAQVLVAPVVGRSAALALALRNSFAPVLGVSSNQSPRRCPAKSGTRPVQDSAAFGAWPLWQSIAPAPGHCFGWPTLRLWLLQMLKCLVAQVLGCSSVHHSGDLTLRYLISPTFSSNRPLGAWPLQPSELAFWRSRSAALAQRSAALPLGGQLSRRSTLHGDHPLRHRNVPVLGLSSARPTGSRCSATTALDHVALGQSITMVPVVGAQLVRRSNHFSTRRSASSTRSSLQRSLALMPSSLEPACSEYLELVLSNLRPRWWSVALVCGLPPVYCSDTLGHGAWFFRL